MGNNGTWGQAFAELLKAITDAFVRFWKQGIVQVALTVGMFLALAAPLLLVVLVLWYLDFIGWRSSSGFYTIGLWLAPQELEGLLSFTRVRS